MRLRVASTVTAWVTSACCVMAGARSQDPEKEIRSFYSAVTAEPRNVRGCPVRRLRTRRDIAQSSEYNDLTLPIQSSDTVL
ncbi:hypothetical protein EJ02DRAFT_179116 [Clathrospora elynae]|uniref:Secreted protein n=1 Tax=Clathrospora elynae TaxID=706981 RepID=A0A6A5SRS2_9PLEO|nr:hypothetical protein EJ02DRAFT_179116 [Clathrospora elynae]